ncbi:DUF551 domain-containing protein [Klebsiella pneumoniae]|uniref:DUF551 domain-containing protein n=1 Tax=Klebsiella pneumoniae TaxID=573 RepID=UPI000E2DD6E0|nr:DUF551 domain-containing protein [Klebsiella pneumoniae]SWR16488.1 Eaa1 [Klebsiella pneumoniae]SWR17864.1 Eaa1 [Klebsiella pneumoniae]
MTKSTITRERAQQIFLGNGPEPSASEERELASMALAAMDSESGCLPLDYLQGHKDGLEWAAQLAEANRPETGDWLYDDPIELAKAIRKGPDMPPAQPVADSEPVAVIDLANLDYLLSGADADVWPPEREEMGDVLLYRHAQPAPVVPEKCPAEIRDLIDSHSDALFNDDDAQEIWNACRAAMLAADPQSPGSEPATVPGKWIPASEQMPPSRHEVLVGRWWGEKPRWCCKWATYIPGHPDAQSSGWLIPGASWTPTHWMALPAGPQEVNHG